MKFVCDRCGKRFASVDEPAPGRVYRIRCRCGHVILVRGPASTTAARAADPKLSRFEPPPPPPPLPAPLEGEREDVRTAPERATEAARPGPGSLASPGADGGGEARAVTPGPARHAELAPREETPAPAPALDETEPEVSDDPFLRAANEAAPIAPAPDAAASGGAALAASLATSEVGARHERPPLSLGLDDAGGGAGRRVLFAGIIALLAALAAAVVWRM